MNVIVFGTGNYYQTFKYLIEEDTIVGFLDNDLDKKGLFFDEKAYIYSPDEIDKLKFDRIYLACSKPKEMFNQLISLGVSNRLIFDIREGFKPDCEIEKFSKVYKKNKRIYVLCPYAVTGGPEALHQLADAIYTYVTPKVYMVYFGNDEEKQLKAPDRYSSYKNGGILKEKDIIDDEESIIVIPEINIEKVTQYTKAKMYLWWLSVDNFFHHIDKHLVEYMNLINKVSLHMCQSYYSIDFIKKCGIPKYKIVEVSDYTIVSSDSQKNKENIVLYNPAKGFFYTYGLINQFCDNNISFIALEKLKLEQVSDLMSRAKVYIDFGGHPGKDRMPREAAVKGCIVITGQKGSAKNEIDVGIPPKYKINQDETDYAELSAFIKKCVDEFDLLNKDFEPYRSAILKENEIFIQQVIYAFG